MNITQDGHVFDPLAEKATAVAADLELWPSYFRSKARELDTVSRFFNLNGRRAILEIGCGGGMTAVLLAQKGSSVTAFDLPRKSAKSHSSGIRTAAELARRLGVSNVRTVGGSVEDLPFADEAFDLVFSGYMLQYVRQKDKALAEMRRVLRPDGVMLTIVPNFTERLVVPFIKLEYIIKRLSADRERTPSVGQREGASPGAPSQNAVIRRLGRAISDWVLLKPDGAYRSFAQEIVRHTTLAWKNIFERNGLAVDRIFAVELLPTGLFDIFGTAARRRIADMTQELTVSLGEVPVLKGFGYSLCLVATKKSV